MGSTTVVTQTSYGTASIFSWIYSTCSSASWPSSVTKSPKKNESKSNCKWNALEDSRTQTSFVILRCDGVGLCVYSVQPISFPNFYVQKKINCVTCLFHLLKSF